MSFTFLDENELANMEDEDIKEYAKAMQKEAARLTYCTNNPGAKFWKRLEDIRNGLDPDKHHPMKEDPKIYLRRHREKAKIMREKEKKKITRKNIDEGDEE